LRRNERALKRSWFSNIHIIIYWFFSCAFTLGVKIYCISLRSARGEWLFNARGYPVRLVIFEDG
jgi:hypothetical protein